MEIKKPMTENQRQNANKLYKYMMVNGSVTKEQMLAYLGWDKKKDRQLRDLISMIAKKLPVIATSDQKGYYIARRKEDIELVLHQWRELDSRIKELEERRQPLIKFYEEME